MIRGGFEGAASDLRSPMLYIPWRTGEGEQQVVCAMAGEGNWRNGWHNWWHNR